ncbi:MAG TPA: outer membrane protein assembly factor BamE [Rhodospirillaceae bacterium]|nr:MAG: hypothetical protein A2018_03840 [Alphaproteobacteria bacterium GWF2_58_20]HAU29716.1 outer membrane protein assembly factor BamE [Rhodospirillaceae bacterium]
MPFPKNSIVFALLLSACTPVLSTEGNFIEDERLSLLKDGVSSRQDVAETLGSPSMVGTFDPSVWYYAGQQTRQVSFHKPEVTNRRVIAIHFGDDGTIAFIDELGLDESLPVTPVDRETPTSGPEMNIVQQLLGNIGKFSPKTGNP